MLALTVAAIAATVAFVVSEARAEDPVVPLSVFRSRPLVGASVIGLLSTAAMCSLFFFISLYLQSVAGYSVLAAGAVFLPMTAVIAVGAPLAGVVGSRIKARALGSIGMALLSLAMLLLSRLGEGLDISGIVLGLLIAGVGVALTATPVTAVAVEELPESRQGLAGALISTSRTVGLAAGVAVMGAILGATTGDEMTSRLSLGLKVNAAIAAAGVIAAASLLPAGRRRKGRTRQLVSVPGETGGGG